MTDRHRHNDASLARLTIEVGHQKETLEVDEEVAIKVACRTIRSMNIINKHINITTLDARPLRPLSIPMFHPIRHNPRI
jgi:hypothetical protein